ncbi:MAG: phosphonatase-like hydrolase [Solirubrobacteraceae bacterium]
MTLDLLVCDIAGTTVQEHGAVYAALQDAVNAAGGDVDRPAVARWMGADKQEAVRALLGSLATDELVEQAHADFSSRLADAYEQRSPEPFAGVAELIGELRADGVRVALTTGFDRAIAEPLLASIGWDRDTVDALVCADEVAAGRPAPYMVFRAMERCGVHRVDRIAVVGDTVLDLRAGTSAGAAAVIGVLTGGVDVAVLGAERHTHLLPGLADLPGVLEQL